VEQTVSLNGELENDVLYHAAIVDQFSSHSIAKAIVAKAQETFKNLPLPENFKEIPGQGAEGSFQGHTYLVGSHALLENKLGKTCFGSDESLVERYYRENKLLSFVARDGVCIGFLVITDKIRPNVPEMISHLRSLGVKEIAMLTGDSKKNAEIIARQAGIRSFKSQLLPEQKVDSVRELLTKYDPVIMVGDGINDAPALATATVGIAMGAYGTAISAEAADIIFLVDDLGRVADTIEIGQRMLYIAKQSILIGIGLSFCLMVIAAAGFIMPAIGALLQEIIDVAVILNALRAR
jgi:P-type E1-E2 ATPase